MVLESRAAYPHNNVFVVHLHRNAAPGSGVILGRVEHVQSGERYKFNSIDELIGYLDACTVGKSCLRSR